jgi:hypothetical protein
MKSPDQPLGPRSGRVAARSSRLASREARKSLLFTPSHQGNVGYIAEANE